MAIFNKTPTNVLSGYSSNGTNMTIPIAAVTGLSTAEAHTTTGDSRSILTAILDTFYLNLKALPAEDRPTKLKIRRTTSEKTAGLTRTYVITAVIEGDLELSPES